jgi:dTDP-glucose pyrophosphorylase
MADALSECRLLHTGSIVEAMRSLERSNAQIVLVVDDSERLIGTLTDGDIRRALLHNATLASSVLPFVNRNFVSVGPDDGRTEVIDLMQARRVGQIPILDENGRLAGLHLLREIIGATERPNWALVMAGGRGTRLWPLTENVPKPMLPVAGRPILERIVLHLVGHGIRRIFLSVNYLAEVIERHFGDGERFGCRIEYLRETQPLGTGGALSLLRERPEAPLLALNGDLVVQFDAGRMLSFHERGRYKATMALHDYTHTVPFGVVETDGPRITDVREKPTLVWKANAGIYVLDPELPARVPPGTEFALPALIEQCLAAKEPVGAFQIEGDWIDVGRSTELKRARGEGGTP